MYTTYTLYRPRQDMLEVVKRVKRGVTGVSPRIYPKSPLFTGLAVLSIPACTPTVHRGF